MATGVYLRTKPAWNKGMKMSEEYRQKRSKAHKGIVFSPEHLLNLSLWQKGKKLSENHKLNLSKSHRGLTPWLGKKHLLESRLKMSLAKIGKRPPNFIKDRLVASGQKHLRSTPEWKSWRESVFKRDNYTCQECKKTGVYLEPHHIVPVRSKIVIKLFEVKNGITLCRPCHRKTIWKESFFEEKYLSITSSKVAA